MMTDDPDLDALFKRLHLPNARRVWRDFVQRAERESWSYRDFLTLLTTEEIAHRQQTRLARLTRRAHFPFLKTIDDFNFTYQSSLRLHTTRRRPRPRHYRSRAPARSSSRLDGPSIRTLHVNLDDAMKEDSDQDADLVRISGKRRSEFPEPTPVQSAGAESCPSPADRPRV